MRGLLVIKASATHGLNKLTCYALALVASQGFEPWSPTFGWRSSN